MWLSLEGVTEQYNPWLPAKQGQGHGAGGGVVAGQRFCAGKKWPERKAPDAPSSQVEAQSKTRWLVAGTHRSPCVRVSPATDRSEPPPQPWGRPRAHDAWGGKQTQKGMWSVSPRGWPAQNGLLHTWEGGSWAPGPGHHSWWGWDFLLRWRKVLESGVSAAWESHLNKDVSRKTRGRRY